MTEPAIPGAPGYHIRPGGPHLHLKVGCTPEQLAQLAKLAAERVAKLAAEEAAAARKAAETEAP